MAEWVYQARPRKYKPSITMTEDDMDFLEMVSIFGWKHGARVWNEAFPRRIKPIAGLMMGSIDLPPRNEIWI